ncbi:MAG: uracil-xanthine permease, partial [Oscillospiraceae bacterium]|nr:uracil-xanthine permease [Oscillospiraceae bacterium]
MVENHTDFQQSRNVIIAALIIGLAIGVSYSSAGAITLGKVSLSGIAVASIVGIVLNAILPGGRTEYTPNEENSGSLGKY